MRNSFVLNSVSSFQQISSSPLNRSSSKNLWSFAKDSRFKKPKVYCDNIYNIPSAMRKRGTSVGYGKKSDFTKDLTSSPGSSKYNLKTIFDDNRKSKRGFSMYVSRQKIPSRGHIPLEPLKFPAPNRYNNMKIDKGKQYTMRQKTRTIDKTMSIDSQNENPGAGSYENPQALSPRGKYGVSKHKGTGATLFNPKSSVRFFQFKNRNPGPGRYNQVNPLSDRGHYPISKSTGYGKRLFDKERRVVEFEKKAKKNYYPGPGSYRSPSEFGNYDGDVYDMNMSMYKTTLSRKNSSSKLNTTSNLRGSRRRM